MSGTCTIPGHSVIGSCSICGGPAFPIPELGIQDFGQAGAYPGMTLRDYFAAKVMPELVRAYCEQAENNGYDYQWMRAIAKDCYTMADAMLAARNTEAK